MDPRILKYYNRELQHIREMGGEFAREFPKIAGRLGMEGLEVADPYVERLLEGFAFLAARVQLKIDAEFPRFTQHLLELVYPHYLSPTPSMAVVEYQPDLTEGSLADGILVPRDTAMRSVIGKGERTACIYRSSHDVTLWPLELTEVRYFPNPGSLANVHIEGLQGVKAGLRFRFKTTAGLAFDELALDTLPIYLRGSDDVPKHVYEQLLANATAMVVRPKGGAKAWQMRMPRTSVRRSGFDDDQALLPFTRRSFQGYRLLQEYFAFPERFLFVELANLGEAVRRCGGTELEIFVLLNRSEQWLENSLDTSYFALFCSPVVNLFPRRADRMHVDRGQTEYHIVPDRTKPMDYEVHSVTGVKGFSGGAEPENEFEPFYSARDPADHHDHLAYYTVYREPRLLSSRQRRKGSRSSYVGSEVYVSLVDARQAPFSAKVRQLEVSTLCTNRDLPLQMTLGKGLTDFSLESGLPIEAIRCVAGPTRPRPSNAGGDTAWLLLSHLSLNYLSLVDTDEVEGAKALRQLLSLYADTNDAVILKQIEGVKAISSRPVTRRLPVQGPITFGRGIEITVTCDDGAFEGTGVYLLGAVMEEFFARYVSTNSFTETVVRTMDRGEVMRWPARIGLRQTL